MRAGLQPCSVRSAGSTIIDTRHTNPLSGITITYRKHSWGVLQCNLPLEVTPTIAASLYGEEQKTTLAFR
jgi:hypothetical protein